MTDAPVRISGPVRLLLAVQRAWALSDDEMATLLDYPSAAAIRAVLNGNEAFGNSEDMALRARIIYNMHSLLARIFVEPAQEASWMRSPLGHFDGVSTIDYMLKQGLPGIDAADQFVTAYVANPHGTP